MSCLSPSQDPALVPPGRRTYGKATATVEVDPQDDTHVKVTIDGPGGSSHCFEVEWHSATYNDASGQPVPFASGGSFDADRIWAGGPSDLARVDKATGAIYVNRKFADEELGINENFWAIKWPDSGGE